MNQYDLVYVQLHLYYLGMSQRADILNANSHVELKKTTLKTISETRLSL